MVSTAADTALLLATHAGGCKLGPPKTLAGNLAFKIVCMVIMERVGAREERGVGV